MNPPKGIDPKVWEMAIALADIWQAPMHHDYQIFAEDVAGAIQKAIEAENEACAMEAMRWQDGIDAAEHIRRRNRSNTTTERNEG